MSRPQPQPSPARIRFAEFELDESNACLLRQGTAVPLAPTPFALLCALARQPGALLSKDALLDAVWGHRFVSESVLKTAISDLRTALGDDARQPRFIETVSRRGYRFIATATTGATTGATPQEASAPFIGRNGALVQLQHAWQRAAGGQRTLVWLTGEPGIGKTALIEQFIAGLGDVLCVRGHCVEHHGTGEPYLPVLEALAELCRTDPALAELLRSVAPTWLLQLPWLTDSAERDALRRDLAGVGPERMLREMGELLDRYTERRPLLLVTEDLHWSDRATVQLLDYLARRRSPMRLMWLASFRVAEVVALDHPLGALRHELRLRRLCEEVMLDPFSEIEVADYLALHSTTLARDEGFVRALYERTDGVPLFVSSLIEEVMKDATDDAVVEARLADMAIPESLGAIIDHHIARLGQEQHILLAAAAVCGVEFRVETLAQALERNLAEVLLACEALVREQVWLRPAQATEDTPLAPHYAFRHALFRQVLYERAPRAARIHLHQRVGLALEHERGAGVPVAAAELAMHFERARQPLTAMRYGAEAARAALQHFSPTACFSLAEHALRLLPQAPPSAERDTLEITLATLQGMSAFHALGVGAEASAAFERAYVGLAQQPAHPLRGRLLHGYGFLLCLHGDYARAVAVARRAEALSAETGDAALMLAACIVQGEVQHLQGRTRASHGWLSRGLALAEAADDGRGEIFAADPQVTLLGMLAIELVRMGLLEQARDHLRRARQRAQALRQPMTSLVAAWQEVLVEVRLGRPARVAELAEEMQRLVDEYSLALGRTACRWWRGWAEAHLGEPQRGYRHIREAYEEHRRLGMRSGASEVLGYAAEALLLAGRHEAARAELGEAMRVAEELGERVYLPQLLFLEAAIAQAQGMSATAAAALRRAVAEARREEAPWLELLALEELNARFDACAEERQALAELLQRLPEAADSEPARRARALLLGRTA